MSQKYYSTSANHPEVVKYVASGVVAYVASILYTEDSFVTAMKRCILTDIGEYSLRGSADVFNLTNVKFPFTAYTFGDWEVDTDKMSYQTLSTQRYSDQTDSYTYAAPVFLNIPMISFFSRADDYFRAHSYLIQQQITKTLFTLPISINSVEVNIPINLEFEVSKGSYAFEFEQQLRTGKIYDVVHNIKAYFHDIIIDTATAPVDTIEFNLLRLDKFFTNSSGVVQMLTEDIDSGVVPDTPEVSNTLPVNNATGVSVTYSPVINFNVSMNEDIVENNIYLNPPFFYDTVWNDGSSGLIIDPHYNLSSGVLHEITIMKGAKSIDTNTMEEDYTLYFTTES